MPNTGKRLIALLLCAVMTIALLPVRAAAEDGEIIAYQPTGESLTLRAEAENTVTVTPKDLVDRDGILDIEAGFFTIERDYEQSCMIAVTNLSEQMVEFYLEASNDYPDISLEIIRAGSDESPIAIEPGETMSIELSVFAQNAVNEEYLIPVTAYVAEGAEYVEDAMSEAVLACLLPVLDLEWTLVSEEASTLRQTWQIKNNGDAITDLVMYASGDAQDYLRFTPVISNLAVSYGETVEFTVQPDLAKMKANGISALNGMLVASSAGKVSTADCTFDTKGEEITVTTMGHLALQQSGNAYYSLDVLPETVALRYFNGTEYVDAVDESLADVVDENREFNVVLSGELDLGIEYTMGVSITYSSEILDADAELPEEGVTVEYTEDGALIAVSTRLLTLEEYEQIIASGAAPAAMALMTAADESGDDEGDEEEEDDNPFQKGAAVVREAWGVGGKLVGDDAADAVDAEFKAYDTLEALSDINEAATDPTLTKRQQDLLGASVTIKKVKDFAYDAIGDMPVIGQLSDTFSKGFDSAFDFVEKVIRDDRFTTYNEILDSLLSPDEEYAEEYEDTGYADMTTSFSGSQCTNRGKLDATAYVPNYSSTQGKSRAMASTDPNGMLLFATSRMYGKGYVNREETNYNILLNGHSAGETHSAGITEIAIAQLSTEHLLMGEVNKISWDYDTDPGTHFVTTENNLHILYPLDTEIGYIGTPEELEDVRVLPDAVIYSENIFVDGDAIMGCPTKLAFNVYNIGSRGGWFNIIVRDGDEVIYLEENHHLKAFSGESFEIDWTPAAETNEISVELVHTSIRLEEKRSDNNMALVTVMARDRQVPAIASAYSDTVYADAPFTLSAYINNYHDVTDVVFHVDGTALEGTPKSSIVGSQARYWLTCSEGLPAGSYNASVEVTYAIDAETTETITRDFVLEVLAPVVPVPYAEFDSAELLCSGETIAFTVYDIDVLNRVEVSVDGGAFTGLSPADSYSSRQEFELSTDSWTAGSHTVVVHMYYQDFDGEKLSAAEQSFTTLSEEESLYSFTIDDTVSDYTVYVYNEYGRKQNTGYDVLEDGTHQLQLTSDMYSNPEAYTLAVITDNAFITKTLDQEDPVFSINDCVKLELVGSEHCSIRYLDIEYAGELNIPDQVMHSYDVLYLTPNSYDLYMSLEMGDYTFSVRTTVDMTGGDQAVQLDQLLVNYRFEMENAAHSSYTSRLYYRYSGSSYWYSTSLSSSFDASTATLYCMSNSSSAMNNVNRAEEVWVAVYSDDELFLTQVKSPDGAQSGISGEFTLDHNDLIPVTFVCEESGLTVNRIAVANDLLSVSLTSGTIYLPAGTYDFDITLYTGTQTMVNSISATIEGPCELIADSGLSDNLADVVVSWDSRFDELGDLETRTSEGIWVNAYDVASGYAMKIETGYRSMTAVLHRNGSDFTFSRTFSDLTNEGDIMKIGGDWTAQITKRFGSYAAGEEISFSLSSIMDANGNTLDSWYIAYSSPLCGNVHFTDVNDEDHVITVPVTTRSTYMYVDAPLEPGTYTISVELFTDAVAVDNSHTHTEVIDPAVAPTCTADGLTEGSHCGECGAVLIPQETVSATGHSFSYTDLGDGTHLILCSNCDHSVTEAHVFSDGSCAVCGAAEHIHAYGAPVFTWTEDHSGCTAAFTCTGCSEVQTLDCVVTAARTDASCTEDGMVLYTAAVEFDGQTFTDIREEILPATGHSYVDGVCAHCGEAEEVPSVPSVPVMKPWWMILLEKLIGWLHEWCRHNYMEYLCPFCG